MFNKKEKDMKNYRNLKINKNLISEVRSLSYHYHNQLVYLMPNSKIENIQGKEYTKKISFDGRFRNVRYW